MQRNLPLFLLFFALLNHGFAQEFAQVATGAGYQNQAFYRLSDNNVAQLPNESWDLAFSMTGQFNVGIAVNESTTSITGAPAAELVIYQTSLRDFSVAVDSTHLAGRILNDESSWAEGGALSLVANPADPFDFGWGSYSPVTHTLSGTRVFAAKLRDGSFKKFIVSSFAGNTFTLKYANFDGSDEKTVAINRGDYPENVLVFFSFSTGEVLAPIGTWDLMFGRYLTKLDDGEGNILDYPVTGVLSNGMIEAVKLQGVNPATVNYTEYLDSFSTRLDVIGHDWKAFSFTQGWVIPQDLVFFAKTPSNEVYKLVFVDFEGSSTGVSTIEKTALGILSSSRNLQSSFKEASVFPNPVVDQSTVVFTAERSYAQLPLVIRDLSGRILWQAAVRADEGLNAIAIPALPLAPGMYFLSVGLPQDQFTLKFIKQ
jgi:hypothetical protein